ncbi:MarR family winged helix-turn-helix transcriptional regulator [Natronospora cellulosivora (SeqCode)]
MDKYQGRDVYRILRRTSRSLKKEFRSVMEEYGLTWVQFHALYHIDKEGIAFKKLSEHLHCNASNLTGLIDRMIEKEFVYRVQSKEDRRVWLIKLTEKGENFKIKLIPEYRQKIEERMSVLNETELETLKNLLIKLQDA